MPLSKLVYSNSSSTSLIRFFHYSPRNFNPEAASSSKPPDAPLKGPAVVTGIFIRVFLMLAIKCHFCVLNNSVFSRNLYLKYRVT